MQYSKLPAFQANCSNMLDCCRSSRVIHTLLQPLQNKPAAQPTGGVATYIWVGLVRRKLLCRRRMVGNIEHQGRVQKGCRHIPSPLAHSLRTAQADRQHNHHKYWV